MNLVYNWKDILAKAWSIKLILLSGFLSGLEVAMPSIIKFFEPLNLIPSGSFALLAALISGGAAIARVVPQPQANL